MLPQLEAEKRKADVFLPIANHEFSRIQVPAKVRQ